MEYSSAKQPAGVSKDTPVLLFRLKEKEEDTRKLWSRRPATSDRV